MARDDQERWDAKWAAMGGGNNSPNILLEKYCYLLSGFNALDLACGLGQNSLLLARLGFQVLAVDISPVALRSARKAAEAQGSTGMIQFQSADLDDWKIPVKSFDVIVVFRFLNRKLFPEIREALHPGGWLLYSTRNVGILESESSANPDYLLKRGELQDIFGDWELIFYRDGKVDSEIVARKPGRRNIKR